MWFVIFYVANGSKKRVDGVNTDVWSGRKSINNGITVLQEWYFLSTEWKNEDSVDQKYKTPIFLKQTFEYWNEQMKIVVCCSTHTHTSKNCIHVWLMFSFKRKEEKFHHFFNYRTQYSELQPYDLSQCAGQQEKKIFFVKFACKKLTHNNVFEHLVLRKYICCTSCKCSFVWRVAQKKSSPVSEEFYNTYCQHFSSHHYEGH